MSELFTMTPRSNFLEGLCGPWALQWVHMSYIYKKKKSENDHETSPQYFTAAVTAEITLALQCKESLRKPMSVVGCGVMTLLCQ